jgi:hypothetical protein
MPSSFADCAVILAFDDELLVLPDDKYVWRTPGGREFAAAPALQWLADAACSWRRPLW